MHQLASTCGTFGAGLRRENRQPRYSSSSPFIFSWQVGRHGTRHVRKVQETSDASGAERTSVWHWPRGRSADIPGIVLDSIAGSPGGPWRNRELSQDTERAVPRPRALLSSAPTLWFLHRNNESDTRYLCFVKSKPGAFFVPRMRQSDASPRCQPITTHSLQQLPLQSSQTQRALRAKPNATLREDNVEGVPTASAGLAPDKDS